MLNRCDEFHLHAYWQNLQGCFTLRITGYLFYLRNLKKSKITIPTSADSFVFCAFSYHRCVFPHIRWTDDEIRRTDNKKRTCDTADINVTNGRFWICIFLYLFRTNNASIIFNPARVSSGWISQSQYMWAYTRKYSANCSNYSIEHFS